MTMKEEEDEEERVDAIRMHERVVSLYPYAVRVALRDSSTADADAHASEKEALEVDAANEAPARVRWSYYFAQPAWLSMHRRHGKRTVAVAHPDEVVVVATAVVRTTHLPVLQQMFLDALMPQNQALLRAWMHMFDVHFGLVDRDRDVSMIKAWMRSAYNDIRAVLSAHPAAHTLTDLLSLLPLVEQGMRDGGSNEHETLFRLNHGRWSETTKWEFYKRMFMPGPARVAVPLPVGLVLFEGRGSEPTTTQVLRDRVRRAPFSTSWHPNVAMQFAIGGEMFVHKIMSDGILGIDAQCTRDEDEDEKPMNWTECEVIVQPLVSFHRVHDTLVLLDSRPPDHTLVPDHTHDVQWVHAVFTHAFLGDVCPCEAQREASEATAANPHTPEPEPKRQRLAGRLQLD